MNKLLIYIILSVLITAIVAGGGVYLLQKSSFEKEKQQMQQQIDSLSKEVEEKQSEIDRLGAIDKAYELKNKLNNNESYNKYKAYNLSDEIRVSHTKLISQALNMTHTRKTKPLITIR